MSARKPKFIKKLFPLFPVLLALCLTSIIASADSHTCADNLEYVERVQPTCTETGYGAYWYCTVCGRMYTSESAKLEITDADLYLTIDVNHYDYEYIVLESGYSATCTEEGLKTAYRCTFCGTYFRISTNAATPYVEVDDSYVIISAKGHSSSDAVIENYVEPTCSQAGSYESVVYCSTCGEEISREEVTIEATGEHTLTYISAKDATCTTDGNKAYYLCTVCGDTFYNSSGTVKYDESEYLISATGHTAAEAVKEDAVEASCIGEGSYTSVVYCSTCGEKLSSETVTVEALGHTASSAVKENTVEATCSTAGSYTSVVYCSVCGSVISSEEITVPATDDHTLTYITAKNATCTEDGNKAYYICSVCGGTFYNSSGTVTYDESEYLISATGHTAAEAVMEDVVEASCTGEGSYTSVVYCSTCGEKLSSEVVTVDALGHTASSAVKENTVEATCSTAGSYTSVVYCSVCGSVISSEEITVPATDDHTLTYITAKNATCTEDGNKAYYICSVCGGTFYNSSGTVTYDESEYLISATGHTAAEAVKEDVVEASCTGEGSYTSVVYCSTCGEKLSSEVVTVDALGHTASSAVKENTVEATCSTAGSYTSVVYCSVCSSVISSEEITVPATGDHTLTYITAKNATCTEDGNKAYYVCSVCGGTFYNSSGTVTYNSDEYTIAAIGYHTLEKIAATSETTSTAGNIEYYLCTECGKYFSDSDASIEYSAEDIIIPAAGDLYLIDDDVAELDNENLLVFVTNPSLDGTYVFDVISLFEKTVEFVSMSLTDLMYTGSTFNYYEKTYTVIIMGDLNSDSLVTMLDARIALQIAINVASPTELEILAGDLSKNESIDTSEARTILRYSLGLSKYLTD